MLQFENVTIMRGPFGTFGQSNGGSVISRMPAVEMNATDRRYLLAKRIIDIGIAFIALIASVPVILLAGLATKLTSPRAPVFFRQQRAGKGLMPFTMYKLRTMYPGAEDEKKLFREYNSLPAGPCFKMKADPRVTAIGRWLRRTSIDELPQLWNVIRGEMSLVGPRPLPLDEVEPDNVVQRLRHCVKPGITCLWQVSGRTEIPYAEWIALDLWYIHHRSIGLDMQILFKTIPAVLSGHGAY